MSHEAQYLIESVVSSGAWFALGSLTTWVYLHRHDHSRKGRHHDHT